MSEPKNEQNFQETVRKVFDLLLYYLAQSFSFLRQNTERTREQVRSLVYTTSDQVLVKAEETRKGVKIRMAILELEHHLNRLYPQIGKVACDLAKEGVENPLENEELKSRIHIAEEYRTRLGELKVQLAEHQQSLRDRDK
ncbi:MAG: hypothetical protein OEW39_07190 [Deltaproteobacteria bacterium]|nr:hypothetical protein [Deltaproteobacteria bacterium]